MKQRARLRRSVDGADALWDVLLDDKPVMTEQTYTVASNVVWRLNHGATGVTECDEIAAAILSKHRPSCTHEYIAAVNFGDQEDNVECRKCGQLWVRSDRVAGRSKAAEFPIGTLVVDAAGNHSFVGKVTEIRSDGVVKVEWETGTWCLTHPEALRRKD